MFIVFIDIKKIPICLTPLRGLHFSHRGLQFQCNPNATIRNRIIIINCYQNKNPPCGVDFCFGTGIQTVGIERFKCGADERRRRGLGRAAP
jgi:hypothetical protein